MVLFLRRPGGQQTKTEKRWRAAARRGLARVEEVLGGSIVTLTPVGMGYLARAHRRNHEQN